MKGNIEVSNITNKILYQNVCVSWVGLHVCSMYGYICRCKHQCVECSYIVQIQLVNILCQYIKSKLHSKHVEAILMSLIKL